MVGVVAIEASLVEVGIIIALGFVVDLMTLMAVVITTEESPVIATTLVGVVAAVVRAVVVSVVIVVVVIVALGFSVDVVVTGLVPAVLILEVVKVISVGNEKLVLYSRPVPHMLAAVTVIV